MQNIKLSPANLQKYGEAVLERKWTSPAGTTISESYIIWDADKINEAENPNPNKRKMFLLTQANGEAITMKQV